MEINPKTFDKAAAIVPPAFWSVMEFGADHNGEPCYFATLADVTWYLYFNGRVEHGYESGVPVCPKSKRRIVFNDFKGKILNCTCGKCAEYYAEELNLRVKNRGEE